MNCPGHMLIFGSEVRSYRDLPLRLHEQTRSTATKRRACCRGLTRVRQFAQDDAHCFVTRGSDRRRGRAAAAAGAARLRRLRARRTTAKLATRPEEFLGDVATWDHAEASCKQALEAAGQPYTVNEGDGAFYGPKIDFDVTDAIGRKWQCATIQLDYQMPAAVRAEVHRRRQRRAPAGRHPPGDLRQLRAVHRAPDRALRRGVPAVAGAGAGRRAADRGPARSTTPGACETRLAAAGLRVEVDERQEKIGYKIREAQLQKIPYMLVVGDREAAEATVAVRSRPGGDLGRRSALDEFIDAARPQRSAERARRAAAAASRVCEEVVIAFDRSPRRDDRTRVNERIRVREVRVIDDTGQQLGIMPPQQALTIARQKGLDLVEIAATASPPVCRIMDFGRYQYQEQKRARQAKKHQKIIEVKEIKFRPKVDEHDYQFKKKHIERFLADGDKVKATVFFRGREMAHPEIGRRILERLIDDLADVAIAETTPRQEGNQMHTILSQRRGRQAPGAQARTVESTRRRNSERSRTIHAETEDAPGRRQAVQEDGTGKFKRGKRVQAAHPDEQDPQRKRKLQGHDGRRRRRRRRSCG